MGESPKTHVFNLDLHQARRRPFDCVQTVALDDTHSPCTTHEDTVVYLGSADLPVALGDTITWIPLFGPRIAPALWRFTDAHLEATTLEESVESRFERRHAHVEFAGHR